MSAATAGARMGKTAKEGQELMDNFFAKFSNVKKLIEDSKLFLKQNGYVEDWAGRRRHLTDYFLPPYEAKYKDPEILKAKTFNPILGCANRPEVDEKLIGWVKKALDSKSNTKFEELSRQALAEGIILSANTSRIAQAERQCLNARIQGGAASLTKLAMINVFKDPELRRLQAKLIITVHDELLVECPSLYAEQVEKRLPQVMIDTAKPYINVPMKCDPAVESRWYVSEYTVLVQEEFKKYEKMGLSREQCFENLYKKHPELPKEAIDKTILTGEDLDF